MISSTGGSGPSRATTCLDGKCSAGEPSRRLASGIPAGARGSLLALYSPPLGKHNRDRQNGASDKDHYEADGKALEVEPMVVVGLHGITEHDGKQEHE